MKKILSVLLGLIIVLSLVGCTDDGIADKTIYTLKLELDGGNGSSNKIGTAGMEITEPTSTKEGFTFDGWYTDDAFTNEFIFDKMPAENMTIYAKWQANEYTITLNLDGGTGEGSLTKDFDTVITEPIPTKEGYTFGGWYVSTDFASEFVFNTMPAEDVSLYAQWLTNAYTITLSLDGGIGNNNIVENFGATITEPVPTKEAYTFGGWFTDVELTLLYVFDTMPAEDITLYAKWELNGFNISLSSNIELATPTLVLGEIIDNNPTYTISAPEVDGYDFAYWRVLNTTDIVSLEASFHYMPTFDVELEAVYEEASTVVEPSLFYETSFEDGLKASYATADLILSGETWVFADALIGSLATDLSVSGNSVRIRNGYIETKFAAADLAQIIFYAGTYGNDDNGVATFEISVDGTTWVVVDSFTTSGTLEEHNYIFDDALFTSLSLDPADSYYMKITSSDTGRTNIDDFQIYTGEGQLVDNTPLYTISFTEAMEYSYLIGDPIDLTPCVATHVTTGATTCDIIGTVDNMVPGVYDITYFKIDENGNTAIEVVSITIINEDTTDYLSLDLFTYYDDAEGLYGSALMDALSIIVNSGFNGVTYGDARYILDETDQDPNNPNNLILVYLGTSVSGTWNCSPCTWNREHVWPQSLLGVSADNATVNSASDLYNLMPANPGENSSRGNSPYSEMGLGYEPRDEVKGDVARALFYMMIMYDELNLVDDAPGIHEMGYLNELLQWHLDDPVDDFELARLEVIFSYQSNRNPFVDYPHFVDLIWFYVQ